MLCIMLGVALTIYLVMDFFSIEFALPIFQHQMDYYLGDFYSDKDESAYGISSGLIFYLIIGVISRFFILEKEYKNNYKIKTVINLLIYSFIVGLALNQIGILVERIVGILNMGCMIVLPLLYDKFRGHLKLICFSCIIVLCVLFFYSSLYTRGGYNKYQYIPYTYKL